MRLTWILLPVTVVGVVASGLFLTSSLTRAVQNPSMSLDMVTTGNTYDDTTNTMTLGTIENCLETVAPGNNAVHTHTVHVVIQNVEDMIGWQARMNYDGGQMRPSTANFTPFTDNTTGQNISFNNLPIDTASSVHRDLSTAANIPAAAPGFQFALIGAVYIGAQTFPVSPDTPAKVPAEVPAPNYATVNGGVLAALNLQVLAGQAGNGNLLVNLDVADLSGPGSDVQIFNGTGVTTINVPTERLGDGFHGEGAACSQQQLTPSPTSTPDPTFAPTATASPTPTAAPTLPPGVTPTPGPGGTPTRTATPGGAAGTPTRTPTPRVTPAALPPTGGTSPGLVSLAYVVLFGTGLAIAGSGTVFAIQRLRRDESQ